MYIYIYVCIFLYYIYDISNYIKIMIKNKKSNLQYYCQDKFVIRPKPFQFYHTFHKAIKQKIQDLNIH